MSARRLLFRGMYRLGFTPWDGHALARGLRNVVEDDSGAALSPGTALDLGCGTGDNAIYLAQNGWTVTGVDFTPRALRIARDKAQAGKVSVRFLCVDITQLSGAGLGNDFDLVTDGGCLHGMNAADRAVYVEQINAVTRPESRLLIIGFTPGALFGVRGIDQSEIERMFTPQWELISSGDEPNYVPTNGNQPVRHYLLARRT
ncbi:class I SAM-dependent methyltransferase [Mycolicibacter sp. MYC123]|uniref:Class I SAM-dependent methyltransferase n=2 Tax=Mycolicibacter TaxID=1073531 RepID=A0ABU5YK44_9MYCO|nr:MULTISPECIES: class I SAM-dependent methyltransferase [unclassified Mycolicibacter]MEB3050421.1 class I SAM-dependent methyltransferase [Mycolicibacter sp. MYC123]MEB3064431.1 class I SAM-dependent methyltransferase [Mycolicibacter sp. MYC101]MEB3070181.1 class I SAM-dependent methyltransferase [Mycolicibacter sp. MYC017]